MTFDNVAENHFDIGFWFSHDAVLEANIDKWLPYGNAQSELSASYSSSRSITVNGRTPNELVRYIITDDIN